VKKRGIKEWERVSVTKEAARGNAKERASSSRAEGGTRCAVRDEQKKEARRLTYPMRRLYSTKCLVPRLILESHPKLTLARSPQLNLHKSRRRAFKTLPMNLNFESESSLELRNVHT